MFVCASTCVFIYVCMWVCVCVGRWARRGLLKSCLRRGLSVGSLWGGREDGRAIVCHSSILRGRIRAFLLCSAGRLRTTTDPVFNWSSSGETAQKGEREEQHEQQKEGGKNIVIGGKTGKLDSHSLAVLCKFDWKGHEVNDSNMK